MRVRVSPPTPILDRILIMNQSYFPIEVILLRTGEKKVVNSFDEVPQDQAFRVIKTRVKKED